jgi:hypothetical protein
MVCANGIKIGTVESLASQSEFLKTIQLVVACTGVNDSKQLKIDVARCCLHRFQVLIHEVCNQRIELIQIGRGGN